MSFPKLVKQVPLNVAPRDQIQSSRVPVAKPIAKLNLAEQLLIGINGRIGVVESVLVAIG